MRAINSCVNHAFINTFSAASYYHDYIQVSNPNKYPSRSNKWKKILKIYTLNFFYHLYIRHQTISALNLINDIMTIVYPLVIFFSQIILYFAEILHICCVQLSVKRGCPSCFCWQIKNNILTNEV